MWTVAIGGVVSGLSVVLNRVVDPTVISLAIDMVDVSCWCVILLSEVVAKGVDANCITVAGGVEVSLKDAVIVVLVDVAGVPVLVLSTSSVVIAGVVVTGEVVGLKFVVDAEVVSPVVGNVTVVDLSVILLSEDNFDGVTVVKVAAVLPNDVLIVLTIDVELIVIVVGTVDVVRTVVVVWEVVV